jgi:hypothetical protein
MTIFKAPGHLAAKNIAGKNAPSISSGEREFAKPVPTTWAALRLLLIQLKKLLMLKNNFHWLLLFIFIVAIDLYAFRAPLISLIFLLLSGIIFIWKMLRYFFNKNKNKNQNLTSIFKPIIITAFIFCCSYVFGYAITFFMEKKAYEKLDEVTKYYEINKIYPPSSNQSVMGYAIFYFNTKNTNDPFILVDVFNWQRKNLNIKTKIMSETSD